MSKRAVIFGYHGMNNFGDDFFLKYILDYLVTTDVKDVTVVAKKESLHGLNAYAPLRVIEGLPKALRMRGYEKWLALLLYSLVSDYLVFCAGSIFTILPEKLFLKVIKTIRLFNPKIKILAIGVSVGPFRSEEAESLVVSALELFDSIIVRDAKSQRYLAGLENSHLARDLAFVNYPRKPVKLKGCIGICLNPYASIMSANDAEAEVKRNMLLAENLVWAYERNYFETVRLFVTCSNPIYGDRAVSDDLLTRLDRAGISAEKIIYFGDFEEFRASLDECEKVIASRLHAGFFAVLGGASVLQLKYAEKIEAFYEGIDSPNLSFIDSYEISSDSLKEFLSKDYLFSVQNYDLFCYESSKANERLKKLLQGVL
jgi:polysaccharide pyruvyl transferase WcaK-like protein